MESDSRQNPATPRGNQKPLPVMVVKHRFSPAHQKAPSGENPTRGIRRKSLRRSGRGRIALLHPQFNNNANQVFSCP
jgi:hypothetical protein